jgi:methionyl-tRNA formyltransferase
VARAEKYLPMILTLSDLAENTEKKENIHWSQSPYTIHFNSVEAVSPFPFFVVNVYRKDMFILVECQNMAISQSGQCTLSLDMALCLPLMLSLI